MTVKVHKKFLKDLKKIPASQREKIEQFVFEESEFFDKAHLPVKIEKLRGYRTFYKVRFGNYRVGLRIEGNILTFERVLHRKEIYRFFP